MPRDDSATPPRNREEDGYTDLEPLHWGVRLAVLLIGGVLTVVGIAGLVLPGIQGILTILLGLAVTSLASEFVHRHLRRLLTRWPRADRMMQRFRSKVHGWLSPSQPAEGESRRPKENG